MLLKKVIHGGGLVLLAATFLSTGCVSRKPAPYVYEAPRAESIQRQDDGRRAAQAAPRPEETASRPTTTQAQAPTADERPASPRRAQPARETPALAPQMPAVDLAPAQTDQSRLPEADFSARQNQSFVDAVEDLDGEETSVIPTGYRLRVGDPVVVHLRGIPEASNYEFMLDESGYISLPYIRPIQALGLTSAELQRRIHDAYINEQIYRQISVNVMLSTQSYFVRGEVRQPGRFPLTSGMTLLKAIAAAGGYTEFANPRRVEIVRGDVTRTENARRIEQDPSRDVEIRAGDVIVVRRSIF